MLPAALRIPGFRRLALASTLSSFGSMMTFIVLPLVLWDETGSATAFAATIAVGSVATIIALPFGGVFTDRFDRRQLLLVQDAVGISGMVATLAVIHWELWFAVPIAAFVGNLCAALCAPAAPALRRDLLPDEHRMQGNSLMQLGGQSAGLLAPLVGAAIYAVGGFGVVAALDIATYVASFLLIVGLRHDKTRAERSTSQGGTGAASLVAATVRDVRIGIAAVRRDAYLSGAVVSSALSGLANGLLLTAAVPWFEDSLHVGKAPWSVLVTILGGTGVVASLALARYGHRIAPTTLIRVGGGVLAVGALAFVGTPPLWLVYLGAATFGTTTVLVSVAFSTVDQERVPSNLQGRTVSLDMLVMHLGLVGGTVAAATLIEVASPVAAVTAFAALTVAVAMTCLLLARFAGRPVVLTEADGDEIVAVVAPSESDLAVSG